MSKYKNITIEELAKLICENKGKSVDFTADDADDLHYSDPSGWHGARLIEFFDSTYPTLVLGYYGGYTMFTKSLENYYYEETGEMPPGPFSPQMTIACVEDIVREYIEDEYGHIQTVCTDWFKPKKNTDEELRMIMENEARFNPMIRNHWANVICNNILKEEFDDVELPPEDAYDLAMEIYDKYLEYLNSMYSNPDMPKYGSLEEYTREVYLKEYDDIPVNLYDDAEYDDDDLLHTFTEHNLTITGEEHDLRRFAELAKDAEGTVGDLRNQIEYYFDIDGFRAKEFQSFKA